MADTTGRARVRGGVPTGGQFATEARAENPGLASPTVIREMPPWDLLPYGARLRVAGPTWRQGNGPEHVACAYLDVAPDGYNVVITDGDARTETFFAANFDDAEDTAGWLLPQRLREWGLWTPEGSR